MENKSNELELWRRALSQSAPRPDLWRNARDLADPDPGTTETPEFAEGADSPPTSDIGRRELFQLLGASVALAGLSGCPTRSREDIVPYFERAPEQKPGTPAWYATSMVIDGFATGLLVESHAGRPTKVDGNPEHPASLGRTNAYHQASVRELYDPNRGQAIQRNGRPASWTEFSQQLSADLGPTPWFVLYPQSSPMIGSLINQIRAQIPDARFCFHTPIGRSSVYDGARAAFGSPFETHYDFSAAERILALDADFTHDMPNSIRWAREFAERRRLDSPLDNPSRLYVVEPCPTPTGSVADHRLAVPAREVVAVAAAVLVELVAITGYSLPTALVQTAQRLAGDGSRDWARIVARDLAEQAGSSIVIAGPRQAEATHTLAHAINSVLGNVGQTVSLSQSVLLDPDGGASLADLATELSAGTVETVVVLESNPVYTAPVDLELGALLARVRQSVHVSLFKNETSRACEWFVPLAHYLETWGAARSYDGTLSIVQPLIRPLVGGRSVAEVLSLFTGAPPQDDRQLLVTYMGEQGLGDELTRPTLQRGFLPNTAFPPVQASINWSGVAQALDRALQTEPIAGLELGFQSGHGVYDGRYADNGWLQELPQPMTKLTWGNAALVSPRTAVRLGIETEQIIELKLGDRVLPAPALILPGHADDAITLSLGYGREGQELLALGVGVNAYHLRSAQDQGFVGGLEVRPTNKQHNLARTQEHSRMHGREIALHAALNEYRENIDFTEAHRGPLPTWLPEVFDYSKGPQWAMTIDTSICTGCSTCVIACQAENNIPIVGKEGVANGREMHWLRIDRYFAGPVEDPIILNQPMMCQHCEKAPCEYVCPVYATTHSPDGLNEMVYNRCVGTRFCSNNCPYKVRRFNWFEYHKEKDRTSLQLNPNVTVRSRGVMEKCTYCVQRIRREGINARLEKRDLRPNEVSTACQQACPTGAIQFGSLAHPDTKMVQWRQQPRNYNVLHELGTVPRTAYLARIRNLNPELA